MTEVVIRRVRVDDWPAIKAVRLEMLEDSPMAFITTLDEARALPDSVWIDRCTQPPDGGVATFGAFVGNRAVGMAIGLDRSRPGRRVVAVVSVYVSPDHRRAGVADRLMTAVEDWAAARGVRWASLWVVDGNDGARAFYEQRGYRSTFDRQKITSPPVRWETRMQKRLRS